MGMKQGYKQTEIGVIPEDWEVRDFGEVGSYYKGGGISMREVRPVGLPCIMYGDIYVKFDTSFKECDYRIDYDTAKNSVKASSQDLFFTASGETADDIGRCVSYQGEDDIYIGGDIIALHPSDEYDSLFLAYVQNSEKVKKQKAAFAQGHSVVHISTDNIKKTLFASPKYPEQKRIAEALSDVDELIVSLEKLIEKKKALKQGVMQELLTGKRRLPGFTGEWKKMPLGKCGYLIKDSINPQMYENKRFSEYSMPAFDARKTPDLRYGAEMHSNRIVIDGEVLLYNKLNVRQKRIWYIENCSADSICSSEFLPYCSSEINLKLLAQILQSDETTMYFIENSTGTSNSQKRITPSLFLEYEVLIPGDKSEQAAIASLLEDFDLSILQMQKRKEKNCKLKSGIMSELLTGRNRLV